MSWLLIPSTWEALAAEPARLEVYDPSGAFEITQLFAPRLGDLHGKTICEVSDGMWQDYRTFPLIRELIQRQFPTAKIVPFSEFPNAYDESGAISDVVKKKGCQAAILGNAG